MSKPNKKSDQNKAWSKKRFSSKSAQRQSREKAKSFLIICEGFNTEPKYFKAFPLGNASVKSYGLGKSKTALVDEVIDRTKDSDADEIWVVFDFDIKKDQLEQQKKDFNQAIKKAEERGIRVAYSNDAFELWFVLHYQDLTVQWTRYEYYKKLSEIWKCNYENEGKQEKFCRKIYQKLEEDPNADQQEAIRRAAQLYERQIRLPDAERSPCTTVHHLVLELIRYL